MEQNTPAGAMTAVALHPAAILEVAAHAIQRGDSSRQLANLLLLLAQQAAIATPLDLVLATEQLELVRAVAAKHPKVAADLEVLDTLVGDIVLTGTVIRQPRGFDDWGKVEVAAQLDDNTVLVRGCGDEAFEVRSLSIDGHRCRLVSAPSDSAAIVGKEWYGASPVLCGNFVRWFEVAAEADLLEFARTSWSCEAGTPLYAKIVQALVSPPGQDCYRISTPRSESMRWLQSYRWGTWAKVKCIGAGVKLVKLEPEPEDDHAWKWRAADGRESQRTFETDTEAALNAVKELDL